MLDITSRTGGQTATAQLACVLLVPCSCPAALSEYSAARSARFLPPLRFVMARWDLRAAKRERRDMSGRMRMRGLGAIDMVFSCVV